MAEDPRELHEMNPTGRFTDRAADYRRHRPDYPAAAIDAMLAGLGPAIVAADVGAGTGISSRLLAARGVHVLAIEPNEAMRAAGERHPGIEWREGTAERTGLGAGSVKLVLSAQAFHWFRPRESLAEFHRILAPRGRLALMWNTRDRSDPLTLGYIEAIHAVGGEHPAETRAFDPDSIAAGGFFAAPRRLEFPHQQTLDREGLIGRATSASYVPRAGAPLERLVRLLTELWERHRDADGRVTMRYVTRLYLTERSS